MEKMSAKKQGETPQKPEFNPSKTDGELMPYAKFQEMVIFAAKEMITSKGGIAPHVLAHSKGQLAYIALPENKNLWQMITAMGVAQTGADMYAFISESWYVAVNPKSEEDKRIMMNGVVVPSQHPDRKEGIFLIFYSRTEPKQFIGIPFKRGSGAEIILDEEMRKMENIQDNRIGNVFEILDQFAKDLAQKRRNKELGGA
jgi:hypothetical protein